jgi:glycosyltransferase 2 family protein
MSVDSRRSKKSVYGTIAGYLLAVAALFWVFHDVNFSVLKRDIAHVNWLLAFLGVGVDMGRYFAQSLRWCLIIRPLARISFSRTFQSLYAGIFLNLLLPFRMGEFARVFLASRYSGADFPSVFSTILTEYLVDGIWLAVGIGAIALAVPLPRQIAAPAHVLGVVVLCAVAAFVFFVVTTKDTKVTPVAQEQGSRNLWKLFLFLFSFVGAMRVGIRRIGRSGVFWPAIFISIFDLVFHAVAFWIILIAYGINLPLITATAILLFIFVGLIVPNAPSNVGSFQFLCVLGLLAFGVDKTSAGGFSVLFFILVNIPQVVIGWVMFSRSGESLHDIRGKLASLRSSTKG